MRKVLAAIAGTFLLGVLPAVAPTASAHDAHDGWFKWREPENNSDVEGEKVELRAKVHFEEGVERWMLEILPPDGYGTMPSWGTVCETTEKEQKQDEKPKTVEIACEWNTAAYPDGRPSRNQAYRARVTAWNNGAPAKADGGGAEGGGDSGANKGKSEGGTQAEGGDETTTTTSDSTTTSSSSTTSSTSTSSSTTTTTAPSTTTTTEGKGVEGEAHKSGIRTLVVANTPVAPSGVAISYKKKTAEATVSWEANPEPDIAHYLVEERFNDGDWSLVAKTTDTTWAGTLKKKGTYRYRVAAVRYVGSPERVKQGPRREPQSGMKKIEADPESTTTESTRPEESSGGKRKEQEDGKKKPKEAEATTSTTVPPDSVIVNFDGSTDPGATSTTAGSGDGTGGAGGASSALSAIEPGSPGSVQTRYADPAPLPAPVSPEQAYDPGFSLALPYPKEVRLDIGPPPEAEPRLLGTVVLFDSNEEQRRALVGVLAGALVVFMVSMQAAYLNRRPRPIDLAASADWD